MRVQARFTLSAIHIAAVSHYTWRWRGPRGSRAWRSHLLRQLGEPGAEPFSEITGVARRIGDGLLTGDYRRAVAGFVDYWNGAGTWEAMRPVLQDGLMRWCPKAPLDFRALME